MDIHIVILQREKFIVVLLYFLQFENDNYTNQVVNKLLGRDSRVVQKQR